MELPLTKRGTFLKQDPTFRIEAIISDGMWYSITKWKSMAKVTENELMNWIDAALRDGRLLQSSTGKKSYRMPLKAIRKWYREQGIELGVQLVDFIFPPRIWDDMTEVDGFNDSPRREIGMVTFSCNNEIYETIKKDLLGIARIREHSAGTYRAYCLSAPYVKDIVQNAYKEAGNPYNTTVRSRHVAQRRELIDMTPEFAQKLVEFYAGFGKSLVKGHQETIDIFLPDVYDQESQMIMWVIEALEKFDESASVPFSGYFNNVMGRWPYNLPHEYLGADLSSFQRTRAKALRRLRGNVKDSLENFTSKELANEMEMEISRFNDLEEKHRVWIKARNATTLNWEESNDEKLVDTEIDGELNMIGVQKKDLELANRLSQAILKAGLETGDYTSALNVIDQLDENSIDFSILGSLDEEFVASLGGIIGVE